MKFHASVMVLVALMQLALAQNTVVMSAAFSWPSGMESLRTFHVSFLSLNLEFQSLWTEHSLRLAV